ncbi:ABC transporter substrate-binding protein [Brevibacterium marinum]|uniref:Peptide/nickel transport system substrate-binding protein n=1 Tax=Brevibacterium marinum TaxID=418643 RepID=A0A846S2J5_9MICO|nr:ABC transporter substrate-binding protein [Brevibacterium marinum]NJC55087.1 peptide/nickel transport system substrate-binding protein [Brevibacterium marinum]
MKRTHTSALVASLGALALVLTACEAPSGGDSQLVIGTENIGGYNPVNGYSVDGNSPFYDGLLRLQEDSGEGEMPDLTPALAATEPEANEDSTTWTVKLREGVSFSDDSAFDSTDVAATYRAIVDPDSASEVVDAFRMIEDIDTPDESTVVFHLAEPTPTFASRLTLGILPSEAIEEGTPAADWKVNSEPVGTGAYRLKSLTSDTAVMEARDDYWRTTPELKSVTVQAYSDSSALAAAVSDGKVSGAAVPPRSVDKITGDDHEVVTARTADWRGLTLPSDNPFTASATVRKALNLAVDREKIVDEVLAGHGTPASTPVGDFYGDAYEPSANFERDVEAAETMLDEAGWEKESDGIRSKDGQRAEIPFTYPAGDSVRGDIAAEVAAQLKPLGIGVEVEAGEWDQIEKSMTGQAIVYAGGEQPYNIDHQIRASLHTHTKTSGVFDNPADVEVPGADELLDHAAQETDEAKAAADYRKVQDLYMDDPSYLIVAFLEHTYVADTEGWDVPDTTFEPHVHGSDWGPWWNLADWTKS